MMHRISLVLALGLALTPAFAQTLPHPGQPSTAQANRRRPQGFTDYALGKINPNNTDFGSSYQAARAGLVRWTIDDLYFWSNCLSLSLLIGVTGFCFLHLRSADKKQRIAAALIAHMWNGRVSDKIEIERRTERYNALADVHNALVEKSLSAGSRQSSVAPTVDDEGDLKGNAMETDGTSDRQAVKLSVAPAASRQPAGRVSPDMEGKSVPNVKPTRELIAQNAPVPVVTTTPDGTVGGNRSDQEIRLLRSQVQALRNREANLLVRLNTQEEFDKQQSAANGKNNQ
jgi:hypothetical protein